MVVVVQRPITPDCVQLVTAGWRLQKPIVNDAEVEVSNVECLIHMSWEGLMSTLYIMVIIYCLHVDIW